MDGVSFSRRVRKTKSAVHGLRRDIVRTAWTFETRVAAPRVIGGVAEQGAWAHAIFVAAGRQSLDNGRRLCGKQSFLILCPQIGALRRDHPSGAALPPRRLVTLETPCPVNLSMHPLRSPWNLRSCPILKRMRQAPPKANRVKCSSRALLPTDGPFAPVTGPSASQAPCPVFARGARRRA